MRNAISILLLSTASATLTTDDHLTWSATVNTTAAGQMGMNVATGRPTMRIGAINRQIFDTTNKFAKSQILIPDSDGLGMFMTLSFPFVAGAGGAADDVIIYDIDAGGPPVQIRIIQTIFYCSTAVAASTVQLRSAAGGGGSALSDSFASSVTGSFRSLTTTVTGTVSTFGSLYIRRSDSGVAGTIVLKIQRV